MKTLLILFAVTALSAPVALSLDADEWVAKAESLEKDGKSREALAAYTEADKLRPNRASILVKIAKQHGDLMTEIKSDEDRKAEGALALKYSRDAVRVHPKNSDSHLSVAISLGKLVEFMGNREMVEASREIKSEADTALRLDPKSDYAHHLLGRWHQKMADMGMATRAIAKIVYGGLPDASLEEALAHFKEAEELRPDRLIHKIEYGRTLAMMGRKDEAKTALAAALAMPSREKDDAEAKQRGEVTLAGL